MLLTIVQKQNSIPNMENKLTNNWTIIRKNNSKIEIINKKPISKYNKEDIEYKKKYNYYQTKMIENWKKYREDDINMFGDLSFYYNSNSEIEEMVKEEFEIQTIIDSINNDEYDDDEYLSDEERNYHLVYN